MSKISPPSKSFIILFFIALAGSFLCLHLWSELYSSSYKDFKDVYDSQSGRLIGSPVVQNKTLAPPIAQPAQVDTSSWKTYSSKEFQFSFKYNPTWKVLPIKSKQGFKVIEIDPGKKYFNIKIYISPKEFYVLDGLPVKKETVSGQQALDVNNMLYGIYANNNYYTFDIGLSTSLKADFEALVHSTKFGS